MGISIQTPLRCLCETRVVVFVFFSPGFLFFFGAGKFSQVSVDTLNLNLLLGFPCLSSIDRLEVVNKAETAILELKSFLLYAVGRQHPFRAQRLSQAWKCTRIPPFNAITQGNS